MADGAPAFITFDDDEPPASAAAKPPPPFITFDDADAPAAAEAPAPPSFITFDEPAAAPPTVARGPTTELSVARDPNAPDPWENQPSLFSQLLTQGWQGVAGGATTQGITNLFGIAAADVPLTPGTTSRRPEIEAYFAMPPEQRLAFKVELSKDPSATAQSIMGILGDIDDGTLRSPEDLDTYNVIPPEPVATPMRQRPAFKRAKELEAWKQRNLPVPQDQGTGLDIYRSLMEGLGTMAASVGTAVTAGPEAAAVSALLSGLGETTQEVYSDENIAAAQGFQRGDQGVQPGLSAPPPSDALAGAADQMAGLSSPGPETEMERRVDAVLDERLKRGKTLGLVAGATDLAPLETLLEGIPGMKNAGMFARVLGQAAIEGGQELVQQLLQNTAVGRQITDGLTESAGVGGGVGAIAQIIKEAIGLATPGRDRGGGTLTPEEQAALAGRIQPSTGGRMNVPPPAPAIGAREGTQQFGPARALPPVPGTTPTVQPTPGPAPSGPVTPEQVRAAHALATETQNYPPDDPRRIEAHQAYVALIARYAVEQSQAAPSPAGVPPAPGNEVAAPAPGAGTPPPAPAAEPPAVAPPVSPAGEATVSAPEGEPVPPATQTPSPPVVEPTPPIGVKTGDKQFGPTRPVGVKRSSQILNFPRRPVGQKQGPTQFGPEQPAPAPVAAPEPSPAKPVTTKDVLGPVVPGQADLKSFVIGQGGVKPTPNLLAQDATQQVGLLDNRGMAMDDMRQAMTDAGYIDEGTDANDAEQLIIDAMQKDAPAILPKRALDQKQAAAAAGRKERQAQLDEMAKPVDDAIADTGRSDITEQERDQMIAHAFSNGDPAEAVDAILKLRPEPEDRVVSTDDQGEDIPFDGGQDPYQSEPGAEGKPQLFVPGTDRAETAGLRITTGPELRVALQKTGSAQDQFGRRYVVRTRPGGGHALLIDGKEAATGVTPKSVIDNAVIQHAAAQKRKAPPGKKQRGVVDQSGGLFSDEGKQASMPVDQAQEPAPMPVGRPAPGKKGPVPTSDEDAEPPGEVTPPAPPKPGMPAPAPVAKEPEPAPAEDEFPPESEADDIAYLAGAEDRVFDELTAAQAAFSADPAPKNGRRLADAKVKAANTNLIRYVKAYPEDAGHHRGMLPADLNIALAAAKTPEAKQAVIAAWPEEGADTSEVPFERLEESIAGETGGADPEADAQRAADNEAIIDNSTLTERSPRAGNTKTFTDVTMSTTSPMNEAAAYADAGLDPDEVKSLGPEARFQALAAMFKAKFGFKTVSRMGTYGQMKGLDAIDHLLDGYRAIRAMMHVLGMPATGASLGGTLSLTVGRMTKRSGFLGVYNPQDHSIELTGRSNGFAHEWTHALDHWLMENVFGPIVGRGAELASRFTRNDGLNPGSNTLEDNFILVMNQLFFNDAALAARVLDLQIQASKVYGPKHAKAGQPTPAALLAQKMIDDVAAGRSQLGIKQKSDYYKTALNYGRGNPYWTNPAEMLARAFEAYVAFKVNILDPDFPSNFITKGNEAYETSPDKRLAETFPKAADRMAIFMALDNLMGVVNTQTMLAGAVSPMPTANELLDDQAFYTEEARKERMKREKARQRSIVARWKNQLARATSLSGWNALLDQVHDNFSARFGAPKDLLTAGQRFGMFWKGWIATEAGIANTIVGRPQSAKARVFMHAIASQLFELAPGSGELASETWSESVAAYVRQYAGKLENILIRHNIDLIVPRTARSPEGMAQIAQRERLNSMLTTGVRQPGTSADEAAAAAAIRTQIFDEIWRDAGRAGLDIGYVEDAPYLPIIPEPHAILADRAGFIDKATELYQLVYDRTLGKVPRGRNKKKASAGTLKDAIQDIENSIYNGVLTADPDIVRLRREWKKLGTKLQALHKAGAPQAQITQAEQDIQDVMDELSIIIGPEWAKMRANQWHDAFVRGEYSAMDTLGPQTKHTKSRVLPSESQQIMAQFIVSDPIQAASIYMNSMSRKIEYSRRFGQQSGGRTDFEHLITRKNSPLLADMQAKGLDPARPEDRVKAILELTDPMRDNRLKMLMTEAQRAGALTEDLDTLSGQIEFMTGRKSEGGRLMRPFSNFVYAWGTLALLPRAWWTSLLEATTVLARTGDLKLTGQVLHHQMMEFLRHQSTQVQDIADLAKTIGLIATEGQEVMLQVTLGDVPMSSRVARFMAEFYERIGLAALTRMQKRAVLAGFNMWLNKLLRMSKGEPGAPAGDKAVARANLADMGISEAEIKPLDDWLHARGKDRQMNSADARTPMGQVWASAARRFVHSVVQEGTKATSPRMMSHPMGRLTFGLMRFAYTFARNILIRPVRQAKRDYKLRTGAGESKQAAAARSFRDNMLLRMGFGFGALWLGHMLTGMLREFLFNNEQSERHVKEGDYFWWMTQIALSRTGVFGPADVLLQAVKGIRYMRDITSMTSGPFLNILLNAVQDVINLQYNNSPNTNTQERKAVLDILRAGQTPLIMGMLSLIHPSGRMAGALLAGLGMLASSNTILQWETNIFTGPPRGTFSKSGAALGR